MIWLGLLVLIVGAVNFYSNHRLENIMAVTREQFDAALQAGVTTIVSKIDDLAAKVAAGTVTTPEDFSIELDLLKSAVDEALNKDPDAPAPTV